MCVDKQEQGLDTSALDRTKEGREGEEVSLCAEGVPLPQFVLEEGKGSKTKSASNTRIKKETLVRGRANFSLISMLLFLPKT